jgi:hypothetical protein
MGRAHANVHNHIEGPALDDTAQLGLGMFQLIVQTAKGIPSGAGMVVLHKVSADAEFGEFRLVIGFDKEAALIPENSWAQLKNARERGFDSSQLDAPALQFVTRSGQATLQFFSARNYESNLRLD